MKFSEIAKSLRQDYGFSQKQLGEKLNISSAAIGHLELGKHEPGSIILSAYADFFNVSVDYLLGRTDDMGNIVIHGGSDFATSPMEQRLILDFRKLPAETQDNFVNLFHNLATGA